MAEPNSNNQWDVDNGQPQGAAPQPQSEQAQPQQASAQPQSNSPWEVDDGSASNSSSQGQPSQDTDYLSKANDFAQSAMHSSGLASVGTVLSAEAAHRIGAYHNAIAALKKGNMTEAVTHAYAAISGTDKGDPLQDAAAQIITQPLKEYYEMIKEMKDGKKKEAEQHAAAAVPGAKPVGEKLAADIKKRDWTSVAGDATGLAMTLGFGLLSGRAPEVAVGAEGAEAAEGAQAVRPAGAPAAAPAGAPAAAASELPTGVRPGAVNIAGERVPVSAAQLPAESQSVGARVASKMATKEGAQKFIDTEVQPAAQKAAQSNFSQAALKPVNKLQSIREETPQTPVLNSVDDISSHMKSEAAKTYQKFDEAVAQDHAEWEKDMAEWKAAKKANPDLKTEPPIEPKKFTDLQAEVREANQTINNRNATAADKGAALKSRAEAQEQLDAIASKHGDVVKDGELDAANNVYSRATRFDWISKKMRKATSGTDETASALSQKPKQFNAKALESMPSSFDNQFGPGAFKRLLGEEGVRNYNDVLNVLRNPIKSSQFFSWLKSMSVGGATGAVVGGALGGGVGAVAAVIAKYGMNHFIDNLMFNPEFGQGVMKVFRKVPVGELVHGDSGEATVPFTGTNNASGESAASMEAINRQASEKAQGIKRVRIDTRSGNEMPLIGPDAVDAKAGPYDVIVQRGPQGQVELDRGASAKALRNVYSGAEGALAGPRGRL